MEEQTMVMAEFHAVGDALMPEKVSKTLGIASTESGIKGEFACGRQFKHKDSFWSLSTGYEASRDVTTQLRKVIEPLIEKTQDLLVLKNKYGLKYIVDIVIKIEEGQCPSMHLESWFIGFLNSIGADVRVDLYADPYSLET